MSEPTGNSGLLECPMPVKRCPACDLVLPSTEYHKNKSTASGLDSWCKACTRVRKRDYHKRNRDARNEASATWRRSNPEKKRADFKAWKQKNPEKYSAHKAVEKAVARGRLIKPGRCQACSVECNPLAHHEDYTHKLDVCWVCPQCHSDIHAMEANHVG